MHWPNISITKYGYGPCCFCGKATARRIGKKPAPVCLDLTFVEGNFTTDEETFKTAKPIRVWGGVCMKCAKRLSDRIDTVIDQIERGYTSRNARDEHTEISG